mgnify:FL=1
MSDLVQRCIDAYWCKENGLTGLHSTIRMARALEVIAAEIRQWAPDKEASRICYLAINEVADQLLQHAEKALPPPSNLK